MLSTWAEARAQAEVVDAEGDGGEEQAEQRRDGPVDGVVVQGGLHHLLHCGKQLASLEPVDRIVPEQTDGFVQEGQVSFEDGQLLEVEIDEMRVDVHVLLLFGVEDVVLEREFASGRDRDFGPLMNPDWRSSGLALQLSAIFLFGMDEPSVAGDLKDLFPGDFSFELAMLLDPDEVVGDQRAQAGAVHLSHGGGAARAEVRVAQLSAESQLGLFQHLEEILVVERNVVFVGGSRHHRMPHGCVEQDRCRHEFVEFEHHFIVEEGHVKDKRDFARAFRKVGKIHLIEMGDFSGGRSESQVLGRDLDVVQKIFHDVLVNDAQWETMLMNSLDQFFDPFVFINERAQVVGQVNLDERHVVQGQLLELEEDLIHCFLQLVDAGRVDLGDVDQKLSFLVTLFDVLVDFDDLNLVHGSKDGPHDSSNESQLSFDSMMINWSRDHCESAPVGLVVPHEGISGGVDECGDRWEPLVVLLGRLVHGPQLVLHGCGVLFRFGEVELEPDMHPVHVHGVVSNWLEHHFLGLRLSNDLLTFSFPDIRESD